MLKDTFIIIDSFNESQSSNPFLVLQNVLNVPLRRFCNQGYQATLESSFMIYQFYLNTSILVFTMVQHPPTVRVIYGFISHFKL